MAREFRLPDVGEGLAEAEIVRWLVPVGGRVERDQPMVEVETDKALMEIPSPFAGIVVSHGAPEGSILAVGEVLVVIEEPGEAGGDDSGSDEPGEAPSDSPRREDDEAPEERPEDLAPIVGTISSEAVDLTTAPRPGPGEASGEDEDEGGRASAAPRTPEPVPSGRQIQTLPMIRKMAKDLDVDLGSIEGSGPGGRITREDVRAAAQALDGTPATDASEPSADSIEPAQDAPGDLSAVGASESRTGERMSATRRTIAAHMERSWREIPHVTTFDRADVGRLLDAKRSLERRRDAPVSFDALVVKAVAAALGTHPRIAAAIDGDMVVPAESFDIGVAVDTEDGLMVVVVDDPTESDLVDLTDEISRLAAAARARELGPERFRGQCFTVSNIGAVGGWYGTPIVPHGTSGILSVGRAEDTPVARDGSVAVATIVPLSFSYDHRLIDGATGRRFLSTVVENLEEPALFLA